jgi:hypothetical protein
VSVAGVVAEGVVHLLEVVDVEVEQRHRRLAPACGERRLLEAVAQQHAVRQVRQRIEMRKEGHLLLGQRVRRARAQRDDAEGEVAGQLFEQTHLLFVEGLRRRRVEHQRAERLAFPLAGQRQRNARTVAARQRRRAPWRHLRIAHEILVDLRPPLADGGAGRPAATFVVAPADDGAVEIAGFASEAGDRTHPFRGIVLGIADPGHQVAAALDAEAADFGEQAALLLGMDQRHVAVAEQAQRAIVALQLGFAAPQFGRHPFGQRQRPPPAAGQQPDDQRQQPAADDAGGGDEVGAVANDAFVEGR